MRISTLTKHDKFILLYNFIRLFRWEIKISSNIIKMYLVIVKQNCPKCRVLLNDLFINKVQYIAINSIEVPRDVLEELQLYEDYPMILELKS